MLAHNKIQSQRDKGGACEALFSLKKLMGFASGEPYSTSRIRYGRMKTLTSWLVVIDVVDNVYGRVGGCRLVGRLWRRLINAALCAPQKPNCKHQDYHGYHQQPPPR